MDGEGNRAITLPGAAGSDQAHANAAHTLTEQAPVAWQDIDGQRTAVSAQYTIATDGSIGFALGQYDPSHPLTIDPTLIYRTSLGVRIDDIAVDAAGNAYVTGFVRMSPGNNDDAYIAKLDAEGILVYTTHLGGGPTSTDNGYGIAVDSAGNAYMTGDTDSSTFPTTLGAFDRTYNAGFSDAFVAKLNATGALAFSTYLGAMIMTVASASPWTVEVMPILRA